MLTICSKDAASLRLKTLKFVTYFVPYGHRRAQRNKIIEVIQIRETV